MKITQKTSNEAQIMLLIICFFVPYLTDINNVVPGKIPGKVPRKGSPEGFTSKSPERFPGRLPVFPAPRKVPRKVPSVPGKDHKNEEWRMKNEY